MNRILWAVAGTAIVVAAGAGYEIALPVPAHSQTAGPPAGAQRGNVPVKVAVASRKPAAVQFDTIGTIQTIASVAVKSRVDAVIDQVIVQDGQFVKAGDVLFKLDSRTAEAQLHQVEATLARDQATATNAQRDVGRYAPLVSKEFVSRQQYDTSTTTATALEATVRADQAQVENARVLLSYYTIVAPIDGRVGLVAIKRGNSIKANDVPLLTLNQIQPIYATFALPQSSLSEVRTALKDGPVAVRALPQGDKNKPVEGNVAFFDNAIDSTSGTLSIRGKFANDEQRLWPGQSVNVSVIVRTDADALVVPPASVQIGQSGNFVYVIKDDNTSEIRPVTVDRTIDGNAVISKGLNEGDKVVIDGQLRLAQGTRVQIVADAPKPGDAS